MVPAMSEASNVWRVALEGTEYEVELDHGTVSGRRVITVDGAVVAEGKKLFDTGSVHDFDLAGHPARLEIDVTHAGFSHRSTLHVDNRFVEPLTH